MYSINTSTTYTLIWSIADVIIERKAKGNEEMVYGDLFLCKIDTATQDSSFDISSTVDRIHEQSLNM